MTTTGPATIKGRAGRRRIVDAATGLVLESGVGGTTLAAIEGGIVLTQTRRDPRQLRIVLAPQLPRIALDAAYAYLKPFAA